MVLRPCMVLRPSTTHKTPQLPVKHPDPFCDADCSVEEQPDVCLFKGNVAGEYIAYVCHTRRDGSVDNENPLELAHWSRCHDNFEFDRFGVEESSVD